MQFFCNFSLVSLSIRPRSRRGAERIRPGEGRLSRPPKTALERSYLTENSSSANCILRPRRKKMPTQSPKKRMIIYTSYMPSRKLSASNPSNALAGLTLNGSTCIPTTVLSDPSSTSRWTEIGSIMHRVTLLVASTPRIRVAKVIRRH